VTSALSGTVLVTTIGTDAAFKDAFARAGNPDGGASAKSMLQALTILNPGFALQFDPARVLEHYDTLSSISHVQWPPAPRTGPRLDRIADRLRGIAPVFVAAGMRGRIQDFVVVADVARIGEAIRGPSPELRALRKKVKDDLQLLLDNVAAYTENNGGPPANLEAMAKPDAKGLTYFLDDKVPLDPWGRPYLYAVPTKGASAPHVFSLGADGKPGGTGADTDLDLALLKNDDG
jgi:general secretion pathway protein G